MPMPEEEVGFVTHFFSHIPAAAITLNKPLKVGDTIHVKGHTTDFQMAVVSMQVEHKDVKEAKAGDSIGIKVTGKCREHDKVYKVT